MNASEWNAAAIARNEAFKLANPYIKTYTDEQEAAYKAMKPARAIRSYYDLPKWAKNKVDEVVSQFANCKIWLYGSYYAGSWIDKETDTKIVELKRAVKNWKKDVSDLDLIISPTPSFEIEKVDFFQHKGTHYEGALIYDNGKYL